MTLWAPQVLTGRRVRLEPLGSQHVDALVEAADDPAIFTWTGIAPLPTDRAGAAAFIDAALANPDRLAYLQVDAETGRPVGSTSFYQITPALRFVTIGYTWLSTRAQGTGINTESKYLMLRHAFDEHDAVRVEWHTHESNARSRAAIEKLGARFEGLLRKHRPLPDGSWRTTALFAMVDDDWPPVRRELERALAVDRAARRR